MERAELFAACAAAYAEAGHADKARVAAADAKRVQPFFDVQTFGGRFVDDALAERLRAAVRKAGL